jgi:hypothetical protein
MATKKNTAEKATTEEVRTDQGSGFCAYVGPTIVGVIQQHTIYNGTKAEVMENDFVKLATSKHPEVEQLIVDGGDLDKARESVKTPGTDLYKAYKAIARRK